MVRTLVSRASARRSHRSGSGTTAPQFNAFLSYSHARDGKLAPTLQRGLHSFAKPWYRLRALRVFRDEANLSASPALWQSIETALAGSEFFILHASPDAAGSPWVDREVAYWCANKPPDKLLIALTDGELRFDAESRDFDWEVTSALPPSMRGAFAHEPRHVDLRWARTADQLSLKDPRFLECVADLAAPLHHRAKDDLIGEDVRQHRRTVGVAWAAACALIVLAVIAAVAAVTAVAQRNVAVEQRQEAVTQRERAEAEARVATSRYLASAATSSAEEQVDLGLLLAHEAHSVDPTHDAVGSLLQTVDNQWLLGFLPDPPAALPGASLAFSADGTMLASGGDGDITVWKVGERALHTTMESGGSSIVYGLAFSPDGRLVAAGHEDGTVTVWDLTQETIVWTRPNAHAEAVTHLIFDAGGQLLATADRYESAALWDAAVGTEQGRLTDFIGVEGLTFSADGRTLTLTEGTGEIVHWQMGTSEVRRDGAFVLPAQPVATAATPGGQRFAVANAEGVIVVHALPRDGSETPAIVSPRSFVGRLAFSTDGERLASTSEGRIFLWDTGSGRSLGAITGLPGLSPTLAFSPDGGTLAAASRGRVALWDVLGEQGLGVPVTEPAEPPYCCRSADVSFLGTEHLVAVLRPLQGPEGQTVMIWDDEEGRQLARISLDGGGFAMGLATNTDGDRLAVFGGDDSDGFLELWDPAVLQRRWRREIPTSQVWDGVFSADGEMVALFGEDGSARLIGVDAGEQLGHITVLQPDEARIVGGDMHPERAVLATAADDGTLAFWDVSRPASPRHIAQWSLAGSARPIGELAFSSDGNHIAIVTHDGSVQVWQVDGEQLDTTIEIGVPTSLAWSPDSRTLVTARRDGTLILWDVLSSTRLGSLEGSEFADERVAVAYARDGMDLASTSADGVLMLWDVAVDSWRERACSLAARHLTADERERYLPRRQATDGCR